MTETKPIEFVTIKDVQSSIIQGFLASIQGSNGSWNDQTLESALILEQFLKNTGSQFIETKKKGIKFILDNTRMLAQELSKHPDSKHSLDSNCIIYGQCFKTLSLVPNDWKDDKDLMVSSYKKLENLLETEIKTLNNFVAVDNMLCAYTNSNLLNPDTPTRKILSWLIKEILSGTHSQTDQASIGACFAKLYVTNKTFVEETWTEAIKERIDPWKELSVDKALNKLLESVYNDTKNQLTTNYSLLKNVSDWANDCKNRTVANNIQEECYKINNNLLFMRMFDFVKQPDDSLLLHDLANYLVVSQNKLDMIAIRSDLKDDVMNAMAIYKKKSQNSKFVEKWKINGLVVFAGAATALSGWLMVTYIPMYGPWLATIPSGLYAFFLTKIYR